MNEETYFKADGRKPYIAGIGKPDCETKLYAEAVFEAAAMVRQMLQEVKVARDEARNYALQANTSAAIASSRVRQASPVRLHADSIVNAVDVAAH